MKNRKIQIDRPEITDNQILKHKNFDNITNSINPNSTSAFKSFKFWGISGLSVVAIITAIILLPYLKKSEGISKEEVTEESLISVITPPVPEADIPYETHIIDNSKDTTIQSETGSLIFIPAKSFIDNKGNALEDDLIEIKYREFHSPYDIFVSGIPMNYDSAGQSYTFESAGMLEMLAYQDMETVDLKKGKEVKIDLISYNDDTDFNLYRLDTSTGIWDYRGKDVVNPINIATNNEKKVTETTSNSDKVIFANPSKPVLQNNQKYSFEVKVNDELKEDFVDVDNVLFEVDDSKCEFDPVYYTISWEKMEINKIDETNFDLKLFRNDKSVNLIVYPVYRKEDYEKAIGKYNSINEENNKKKAEIVNNRQAKVYDVNINEFYNEIISGNVSPESFRTIGISSMGVWNCDKPTMPQGTKIEPSFVNNYNEEVKCKEIYVVERDKNQLNRFSGSSPEISVNTRAENVMWSRTNKDKIAISSQSSINSIEKGRSNKKHTFEVKEYDNIGGVVKLKELIDGKTGQAESEKKLVDAKTYPNPFTNYVNIDLSEDYECIVQLLNANGQLVDNIKFYGSSYEWKLSNYPDGNYIVVVLIPSLNYKESFKIVKQ
ncbi:MAG: T9SS type A sorting domain-containing protein [Bacteroidota bacterium]